jgi:hypothetical protein
MHFHEFQQLFDLLDIEIERRSRLGAEDEHKGMFILFCLWEIRDFYLLFISKINSVELNFTRVFTSEVQL